MKNRKIALLLVAPLLSVCALSGCSNEGGDEITIAVVSDNAEYTTIMNFVNSYKKQPGNEDKEFKVVKMTNYNDYVKNSISYDELADIVQVYDYNCEYYANADLDGAGTTLLQPISSYMSRDGIKESDFFESVIEMTKCKTDSNDMYWVPRDYNKVVCAYNKKIFDIAGVSYPTDDWSWSDFVSICQQLKAKDEVIRTQYSKSGTFFPVDMNLDFPAVYYPILKTYGAELIDKATKTCFGDTDEKVNLAKTAWNKLLEPADNKLAVAPGGSQIPFTSKQTAMMFMVRPNLPTYVAGLGEDAIDFVTMPKYEGLAAGQTSYIGMGCTGYGMTTSCPEVKKEAVWDFLKYIISEDGQNAFSEAGSGIPCLVKLAEDENAVFKKYMVSDSNPSVNHEAFVAQPERDIPMNFMKGFEVNKQITIDNYIKVRTLKDFFEPAEGRDAYFLKYKEKMEEIWNKK